MKKIITFVVVGISMLMLSGCATIVGSSSEPVTITSSPAGADFSIVDEKGTTVTAGKTPQTVTLIKSDGSYFGGKTYTITFKKDGVTNSVPVKATPNGWYIAGNFVFGGFIGWLIVDPLNGGMYNLSPSTVNSVLN